MKHVWIWMAALVAVVAVAQAGGNLGTRYWNLISGQDYRYTWHYVPGKPMGFYKGTEPHGATLRTFVNNIAFDAIQAKNGVYPVGSVIAKDNHMPDNKLAAITVMVKMEPGYDPANGDWWWAKYDPNGKFADTEVGKVQMCSACHAQAKGQDYVFSTAIK